MLAIGGIIEQIMTFLILMGVGYLFVTLQILNKSVLDGLAVIIIKLILPIWIMTRIIEKNITVQQIMSNGTIVSVLVVSMLLLYLLANSIARSCKLSIKGTNSFILLVVFGNIAFIDSPNIYRLFGLSLENNNVAEIMILLGQLLLWTVGVYINTRHKKGLIGLKQIINPMTVIIFLALFISSSRIKMPTIIIDSISILGEVGTSLSLVYLGAMLANISMLSIWKKPYVYLFVVLKMCFMPVILYVGTGYFFSSISQQAFTIVMGLPSSLNIAMMMRLYGGDEVIVGEILFISTMLWGLTSLFVVSIISIL